MTPLTAVEVAAYVAHQAKQPGGRVVANINLHGLYLYHTDIQFKQYCDTADLLLIDGFPLLCLAAVKARREGISRWLSTRYRVGSTDWLAHLLSASSGLRILAIGGSPESSEEAARRIRGVFGAEWEAVDGFEMLHRGRKEQAPLHQLIEASEVVLVGLGMPLQETWINENRGLLAGKVVANVGGCIDYFSGHQHLAPRFLGAVGMEWLYRLVRDPRRLWRRYLLEPLLLVRILTRRAG